MTRLVALLLIAIIVWLLLEWGYRKLMGAVGLDPGTGRRPVQGSRPSRNEALVRCDACGTYVPDSRALAAGGRRACSLECRNRLLAGGGP
jgi:hypothetical protein